MVSNDIQSDSLSTEGTVSRRVFISAAGSGGAAGFAGCLGESGNDNTNGNSSDNSNENSSDNSDEVTITIVADESISADDDAVAQRRESYVETLHQAGLSDHISIEFEPMPPDGNQVRDQYQNWMNAQRESPDLLQTNYAWGVTMAKRGSLQSIEDVISDDTINQVNENMIPSFVDPMRDPDGELTAVPWFTDIPLMIYRKDLVEDAGYDPEGENWRTESMSWKEMAEIADDTSGQNQDVDHGFVWPAGNYAQHLACCVFAEYMHSWGGTYYGGIDNYSTDIGDRTVTTDEEPVLDSIRMILSFLYGPDEDNTLDDIPQISPTSVMQWNNDPAKNQFVDGNAIFHRNWPFAIADAIDAGYEPGEDLGVMPLPYGVTEDESDYDNVGGSTPALGGWHMSINPHSSRREEAGEVLDAMLAEESQLELLSLTGFLPASIPIFSSDEAASVENTGFAMETLGVSADNAISRPVSEVWDDTSSYIYQEAIEAYQLNKTPEEAGNAMKERIEEYEEQHSS